MNNIKFEKVIKKRIEIINKTLARKGKEYALVEDRLKHFKDAGLLLESSPERALFGYVCKHIIALRDFIDNPGYLKVEQWDEKIGDIINYMILLEALIKEKK